MNSYFLILGCGHSESLTLYNNNALLTHNGKRLLIDCGYTIKYALNDVGMSLSAIDDVLITHVHGDHVFGLERLAFEAKFKFNKRVRLYLHRALYDELWEQTLKGSLGMNGDGPCELDDYFDVHLVDDGRFDYHGLGIDLFPVRHSPGKPCFGVLFGSQVLYTGDTQAIPDVLADKQFDVGFHDVTLAPENPVHATLSSLLEAYPKPLRKKLYLMSYEDHWREYRSIVDNSFRGFCRQGQAVALR